MAATKKSIAIQGQKRELASEILGSPEKRVGTEQMNNIQKTDNRVELGK